MKFSIQMSDDEYRICINDSEYGAVVPYGYISAVRVDEDLYYAEITDPDDESPSVFCIDEVTQHAAEIEEVKFSDDGTGIALRVVEDEEDDGDPEPE